MRKSYVFLSIFTFIMLCLPVLAQDNFTQVIRLEDESLSARIPEDYVWLEQNGIVVVANTQDALDRLTNQENLTDEDRLLFIFTPQFLVENVGAAPGADLMTLAEGVVSGFTGPSTPIFDPGEIITLPDGRLAVVAQSSVQSRVGSGYLIVDNVDGRFFGALALTTPQDIEEYGATLAAIALTITLPDEVSTEFDPDRYRQWAVSATATSQYGADSWSAMQAVGAPNTPLCGDQGTAWASLESTGVDALTLNFIEPVSPAQINIYQSFTPGAIVKVEVVTAEHGDVIALPNSADPPENTPCPGVFTIDITDELPPVNQVIIHVDQTITQTWDEIDAVELVGKPVRPMGIQQWAKLASATSSYTETGWSAIQAAGQPPAGVAFCGDNPRAWASLDPAGVDALTLTYAHAVVPSQINIYQTYNPGSIVKVEVVTAEDGEVIELEDSDDPPENTPCPGIFTINITGVLPPVNQVIIHVDQSTTGNWNQIDAVQLIGVPEPAKQP